MDLLKRHQPAPAEEATAVERRVSVASVAGQKKRKRMSRGRGRKRMSRRGRSYMSAERRPSRSRRTEMSREERTIARQRRQIAKTLRELNAVGKPRRTKVESKTRTLQAPSPWVRLKPKAIA